MKKCGFFGGVSHIGIHMQSEADIDPLTDYSVNGQLLFSGNKVVGLKYLHIPNRVVPLKVKGVVLTDWPVS